jgi:hypothetical protein
MIKCVVIIFELNTNWKKVFTLYSTKFNHQNIYDALNNVFVRGDARLRLEGKYFQQPLSE